MGKLAVALAAALVGLLPSACDVDDTVDAPDVDAAVGGGGQGGAGGSGGAGGAGDAGPGGCATDDDCAPPRARCRDDGACVACLGAADCPADRPVCDAQSACVAVGEGSCREAFDCPVERPQCSLGPDGEVGVCVACFDDLDCEDGPLPLCSSAGVCVGAEDPVLCQADAECGPGRVCLDGGCEFP